MSERSRIHEYFAPLSAAEPGAGALRDDAAVLAVPAGKQLVITTDSVIEGIHLLAGTPPQHYARKLMRRNLSDLAAMGATPWRYTLNMHTPRGLSDDWVALFAATLAQEQEAFGLTLIGGDTTSGTAPLHLTLTCLGLVEGAALHRRGACEGDDLYVSGYVGDAAAALYALQHHLPVGPELAARYYAPTPRLALGDMLRGVATAAIDISDGLLADLQQLCTASSLGAQVYQQALPLSSMLQQAAPDAATMRRFALSGGDDYELLFTAPAEMRDRIEAIATALALPLTRIGTLTRAAGITVRDDHGRPVPILSTGFEHG